LKVAHQILSEPMFYGKTVFFFGYQPERMVIAKGKGL
jgi:hypothetical protein